MMRLAAALPYSARLMLAITWIMLSCIWTYQFRSSRPGLTRAVAALVVVAGNILVPLAFHPLQEFVSVFFLEFAYTWMTNFKVLAWVVNRGPLSLPWTFTQFAAIMAIPITPAAGSAALSSSSRGSSPPGPRQPPGDNPSILMLRFMGKLALIGAGVAALRYNLPEALVEYLYSLGLYAVLSLAMDGPSALITAMLGFEVAPHFSEPWRSCSLGEFWSKRWDLVAGNSLRNLIYDPILEGRLVRPAGVQSRRSKGLHGGNGGQWRRLVGMAACFVGSAAMHELQFWYFVQRWSGGRYGGFFLVQIPAMAVERGVYQSFRRHGMAAPPLLRAAATQLFLLAAGHLLFWAPLKDEGIMEAAVAGVSAHVAAAGRALGLSSGPVWR